LYIIQNDKEDWNIEARRMGAIYANSYFTIAVTAAEHSGEDFLKFRILNKVSISFRRSSASEIDGNIYFRNPSDFIRDQEDYVLGSSLLKRA
jgi:hypothetical protein